MRPLYVLVKLISFICGKMNSNNNIFTYNLTTLVTTLRFDNNHDLTYHKADSSIVVE